MKNIFKGKVILISGGTGFLGRNLVKYFLKQGVHSVRAFSRDEVKHHKLQEMFNYDERIRCLVGDVRDYKRVKRAVKGADIVIHAAALKRLDMLEYNPLEGIKTNILGSANVIRACLEENVEKAVMVSTDKAVNSITAYGATKFLAERLFTESNYSKGNAKTVFTTVRYGNVLNSTGSVIPLFKEKIAKGEQIPLTNPNMTRFIISDEEAGELIVKAVKYGVGGEVFVPQLPAFNILDLISLLKDGKKVRVKTIGIRVNEKLHELMINEDEMRNVYKYKDLFVLTSPLMQKYQPKVKQPIYIKDGMKVNPSLFRQYCSKDVVLKKDKLKEVLKKWL